MKTCLIRSASLFGPRACGRDGVMYDRARKGWLCREHTKERLCEFCQAEPARGRRGYIKDGIACDAWLCPSCAGWPATKRERP